MLQFRFYIDNVLSTEEPKNWDAFVIKLQRSDMFTGLENIFSDNLEFWNSNDGGSIIKQKYIDGGVDAECDFKAQYRCSPSDPWTDLITGVFNFTSYKETNNVISIKIEDSSFRRTFLSRIDTPVSFDATTNMDGNAMSTINTVDIGLHSKTLQRTANFKINQVENTLSNVNADWGSLNEVRFWHQPLLQLIENDSDYSNQPSTWNDGQDDGPSPQDCPIELNEHLYRAGANSISLVINYSIDALVTIVRGDAGDPLRDWTTNIRFNIVDINGNLVSFFEIYSRSVSGNPADGSSFFINQSGTINVTLQKDQFIYLVACDYQNRDGSGQENAGVSYIYGLNTFVNIKELSKELPSTSKALLIHEAFAKCCEYITGRNNSFRSDFFGRTNSSPNTYTSNGCGAFTAVTNGLNLRKMKDNASNLKPITASFKNLYEYADKIWNLGLRIEKIGNDEYVRVEPKEYFFSNTVSKTFDNVLDISTQPANELLFNEFEIGYTKWNFNVGKINGLDEFNSKRIFSVPQKKVNKRLQILSGAITSGYAIENTRRVQFSTAPTSDFETDNDIFFIALNQSEITSNLYSVDGSNQTYAAGTVSERNENVSVTNGTVIDPSTSYNLRFTPLRNAYRWWNWISAMLYRKAAADKKSLFHYGEGNSSLISQMLTGICLPQSIIFNEGFQIYLSNATDNKFTPNPIFEPEYINFEAPLKFSDYLSILAQSEKKIGATCSDSSIQYGYIKEMNFSPNGENEGGFATFKLLKAAD